MTWKFNRFLHSPKKAVYLARFISINIISFFALMGRLLVPSMLQYFADKGSRVILLSARISPFSLSSFGLRRRPLV
jgi:hypothetical protein